MPTTAYTEFTAGVRALTGRTTSGGVPVDDYSAEEDRFAQAFITEGALTADAFLVQADTGMDVAVGSGAAKADLYAIEGSVAGQGVYLVRLDEAPVSVTIPAADAAQPRIDEVYLVVADAAYDGGSVSLPRLSVRSGDPGGGAPGPDGGWDASVLLATVAVGASVTEILAGNITDNRAEAGLSEVLANAAVPAGAMMMWPTDDAAPSGWHLDGATVSRTANPRLFARYGTTYGSGDGSTTFGLPTMAGRGPMGYDAGQTEFDTIGETGGSKTHTLTAAEMPAHTHTGPSHTHSGPNHSHDFSHAHGAGSTSAFSNLPQGAFRDVPGTPNEQAVLGYVTASVIALSCTVATFFGSTGGGGTGATGAAGTGATGSAGSGSAHNNLHPYLVTRYIIKAG